MYFTYLYKIRTIKLVEICFGGGGVVGGVVKENDGGVN
jgi:hypothetical protein